MSNGRKPRDLKSKLNAFLEQVTQSSEEAESLYERTINKSDQIRIFEETRTIFEEIEEEIDVEETDVRVRKARDRFKETFGFAHDDKQIGAALHAALDTALTQPVPGKGIRVVLLNYAEWWAAMGKRYDLVLVPKFVVLALLLEPWRGPGTRGGAVGQGALMKRPQATQLEDKHAKLLKRLVGIYGPKLIATQAFEVEPRSRGRPPEFLPGATARRWQPEATHRCGA
jgi:hypothetical protein